jgi:hypothetical protein
MDIGKGEELSREHEELRFGHADPDLGSMFWNTTPTGG